MYYRCLGYLLPGGWGYQTSTLCFSTLEIASMRKILWERTLVRSRTPEHPHFKTAAWPQFIGDYGWGQWWKGLLPSPTLVAESFSCLQGKDKDEADLVWGRYSHSVHREEVGLGDKQAFLCPTRARSDRVQAELQTQLGVWRAQPCWRGLPAWHA